LTFSKCDLKQPVCSRCARWPSQCKYATNFVIFTPPAGTRQSPESRAEASDPKVSSLVGGYTPSLPKCLPDCPSPYLQHPQLRFFMHHFATQTCDTLFPFAPPQFGDRLIRTAIYTPHLLYAALTASCSHHTRLVLDDPQRADLLKSRFTNLAITNLRKSLEESAGCPDLSSALTAMMLCTNDVCHGDRQLWKTHLHGARDILTVLLGDTTGVDETFTSYLVKWYSTLDIAAILSGRSDSSVSNGRYWPLTTIVKTLHLDTAYVDNICGYSIELWPFLARLGALIHKCESQIRLTTGVGKPGTTAPVDSRGDLETKAIEAGITALVYRPASEETHRLLGELKAEELRWTHAAFVYTALLHLHRRVLLLPKTHEKVRTDITNILNCIRQINSASSANILILWPIFSTGCDTDIPQERAFVKGRMMEMKVLGLGNFSRAHDVMVAYWDSGSSLHWNDFIAHNHFDIVLF
ncbi:fungal-specific transcription factor domain-containing protein, partial [Truncatella angustata]